MFSFLQKDKKVEHQNNAIDQLLESGVLKSIKLYASTCCDACAFNDGKLVKVSIKKDMQFYSENKEKQKCCTLPHCRCYWRPEDISIE